MANIYGALPVGGVLCECGNAVYPFIESSQQPCGVQTVITPASWMRKLRHAQSLDPAAP